MFAGQRVSSSHIPRPCQTLPCECPGHARASFRRDRATHSSDARGADRLEQSHEHARVFATPSTPPDDQRRVGAFAVERVDETRSRRPSQHGKDSTSGLTMRSHARLTNRPPRESMSTTRQLIVDAALAADDSPDRPRSSSRCDDRHRVADESRRRCRDRVHGRRALPRAVPSVPRRRAPETRRAVSSASAPRAERRRRPSCRRREVANRRGPRCDDAQASSDSIRRARKLAGRTRTSSTSSSRDHLEARRAIFDLCRISEVPLSMACVSRASDLGIFARNRPRPFER